MLFLPGVATRSSGRASACSHAPGSRVSAFSMFAAYSQAEQETMASSPESASTMNSWEEVPPMEPVSASTARNFSPQRSKIRR